MDSKVIRMLYYNDFTCLLATNASQKMFPNYVSCSSNIHKQLTSYVAVPIQMSLVAHQFGLKKSS